MAKSDEQVIQEFNEAVNMTRKELEDWLRTDESQSVGQSDEGGESKGHESGRKIAEKLKVWRAPLLLLAQRSVSWAWVQASRDNAECGVPIHLACAAYEHWAGGRALDTRRT